MADANQDITNAIGGMTTQGNNQPYSPDMSGVQTPSIGTPSAPPLSNNPLMQQNQQMQQGVGVNPYNTMGSMPTQQGIGANHQVGTNAWGSGLSLDHQTILNALNVMGNG